MNQNKLNDVARTDPRRARQVVMSSLGHGLETSLLRNSGRNNLPLGYQGPPSSYIANTGGGLGFSR